MGQWVAPAAPPARARPRAARRGDRVGAGPRVRDAAPRRSMDARGRAAAALYEAAGFAPTGARPSGRRARMELAPAPAAAPDRDRAPAAARVRAGRARAAARDALARGRRALALRGPADQEESRARLERRIGADALRAHRRRDRPRRRPRRRGGRRRLAVPDQRRAPPGRARLHLPPRRTRVAATRPRPPRALLDLGFGTFGLHRVIGATEARNIASARVLESSACAARRTRRERARQGRVAERGDLRRHQSQPRLRK